jgi:hypothetical protein
MSFEIGHDKLHPGSRQPLSIPGLKRDRRLMALPAAMTGHRPCSEAAPPVFWSSGCMRFDNLEDEENRTYPRAHRREATFEARMALRISAASTE